MDIAVIGYDGFTDIDLFLPWDFLHRVTVPYGAGYEGAWRLRLCADTPKITSYSGVVIEAHAPLSEANHADAVFIVSGDGSRAKLADTAFMSALKLDPSRQVVAAIDSGVLILARLGLLDGLSATTYPTVMPELAAAGVRTEHKSLVVHGNLATGGGCLAGLELCAWVVTKLIGPDAAAKVLESFQAIGPQP